jgi:hypothetical protein
VKGILDIEFILSVIVFLGVTAFCIFIIAINIMPTAHRFSISEDMKARSYQVSELLLFSQGNPKNWNETNVSSLGLSSEEFYILNATKIYNLKNFCQNNYVRVRELLGQDYSIDFVINVTYENGSSVFLCNQRSRTRVRPEYTINRLAILNESGSLSIIKFAVGLIK